MEAARRLDQTYERIRLLGQRFDIDVHDGTLLARERPSSDRQPAADLPAAVATSPSESEDRRKGPSLPATPVSVSDGSTRDKPTALAVLDEADAAAARRMLQVFERVLPSPPGPSLPFWSETSARRHRPREDDEATMSNRRKRRRSDDEEPRNKDETRFGAERDSERRSGADKRTGDADRMFSPMSKPSLSNDQRLTNKPENRSKPNLTSASERGRYHKHEADKMRDSKDKTLRNLHYLAAMTFFLEHAFRSPTLEKATQDFVSHVVRGLHGDDPILLDLGKRLDGIYGIHRLSRRQRQVDSLATSMQLRLDKEDEASMKSDTETLCQQVLFLAKEDYANVKLKWRDLDNTKDPPPETAQINAFTDATKAIAQARDVLAAYCRRKAIPFEIAG